MKQSMFSSRQMIGAGLCAVVLVAMLNLSIIPQSSSRVVGDLWLTGVVMMNGTSVPSGITVFSDSRIKTTRNSSATVNLGKLGRIKLEPDSEMVLQFSNGLLGGTQFSGLAALSANKGIKSKVTTPHVVVELDSTDVGLVSVDVKPEYTCVVVNRGSARLTAGQKVSQLGQGQALSFDARGPERVGHCEGFKGGIALTKPLMAAGAVTAASLIPLTRDAITTVQGGVISPGVSDSGTASNQSSPPPTSTATNNPTTPVKPAPPFSVCNCKYDKDGKALSNFQTVTVCYPAANGTRTTATVTCPDLLTYFNLNGTPRAQFASATCGACR